MSKPWWQKMECLKGDITKIKADVIVNAANSSLLGGGGVDGAIHKAGGPAILDDCKKIVSRQGGCQTGQAVVTTAGCLPARYVIHTVGPVWKGGQRGEAQKLVDCYRNALQLAYDMGCRTIAFPNISTGSYGFPKKKAATLAVKTVSQFLSVNDRMEKVLFVCFDDENSAFITRILHDGQHDPAMNES